MSARLIIRRESWPIRGSFAISRGSRTTAEVIVVEIAAGGAQGYGECVPYARYGENLDSVEAEIESVRAAVESGADRAAIDDLLPAGAARNAVDCALWDLEAKQTGRSIWDLAGTAAPAPVETAYTLSLDTPEAMGRAAAEAAHRPLLKLKLTGEGDLDRVQAVRANAPDSRLIVDANEAWSLDHLNAYAPTLHELGVVMIEQPLPAGDDEALRDYSGPVILCADESCHDLPTLDGLSGKYGMINIKLDKTGGLTEALALRDAAREQGFQVMVGCMLGTSLAMAPAVVVARGAEIVDLDGPLLLARDREPGLVFDGAMIQPPDRRLWG